MPQINESLIENWFTYHAPNSTTNLKYEAIRKAGRELALTIFRNTPEGADQSDAIRSVRNSVMTANQAIAVDSGLERSTGAGR
jgi:RNA-splicing ligase RtcB